MNGWKKWGAAGLAAAAAAGVATGLVSFQLPEWMIEMTRLWGPGFLMIGLVFAGFAYYVPRGVVKDFVVAQQDQAVAMGGIKDQLQVMTGQSNQLHEIKETLSEILTHQHVNGERLKTIEMRLGSERRADDT